MSVSPAQNFSKPPLVPAAPTVMFTSGLSWLKSSAAASANGCTVLEPSIVIEPERPVTVPPPLVDEVVVLSSPPHAAAPRASAMLAPTTGSHFLEITWMGLLLIRLD